MVGTYANGWLAQLRNEWCRDRCMKPRNGDPQLRSVHLSYSVALQALEPGILSTKKEGLDATTRSRSHGEEGRSVFV
jgi:hypothetical protein